MKKLQVLINGQWEYVFCRNEREVLLPVITKDSKKAITERAGDCQKILEYFKRYFTSLEFRMV